MSNDELCIIFIFSFANITILLQKTDQYEKKNAVNHFSVYLQRGR